MAEWQYIETDTVPWNHMSAEGNADNIASLLYSLDFTLESIAGILGNMEHESFLNPAQHQIGGGDGLGLIQWTPSTSLINYVPEPWYNGNHQVNLVVQEMNGTVSGRWLPTSRYPYSYEEFKQLTDVVESTEAYCMERERAGVVAMQSRIDYAMQWYDYLGGHHPHTKSKLVILGGGRELLRRMIIHA